jgi:hypothetical protein
LGYVHVKSTEGGKCVIVRDNIPETLADGVLKVQLIKDLDGTVVASKSMNISVVNPDVIMLADENPEVMEILYNTGKISNAKYLLRSEAQSFVESDFFRGSTSIFEKSRIKTFNEFEEFTGLTRLRSKMFGECGSLTEIKLPSTITHIESSVFNGTKLEYIYIPENITYIDLQAFVYASSLKTIDVSPMAGPYHSYEGCVYSGATREVLYVIPPAKEIYVMPEETISIYNNAPEIFLVGRKLKSITLNSKIQGFTGK